MDKFAFIIHPIDPKRDVSRKFPFLARVLSERLIHFLSAFFPPVYISEINGITSAATGRQIGGWFVACPLTPLRMLTLPEGRVYRKIIQTGRLAESLGAQILGLGAFTSVVGDGGLTIARSLKIPTTTGDSYTVWVAVQTLRGAARLLDIRMDESRAAVVGATGAIGSLCAELLAHDVAELALIGRSRGDLEKLRGQLIDRGAVAHLTTSVGLEPLRRADLVLSVTSSLRALIEPQDLKSGSVVCDVALPRDVSSRVAELRPDVLILDGGMVKVPGPVDFHFDFGFPPGNAYACMAETMALALEGRFESFSLGKEIHREQVEEIAAIASRHGFRLSGLRSFGQPVQDTKIDYVRAFTRGKRVYA